MESAKQLRKIIFKIYKPNMKILDVGCASGHYYNSLKKIDNKLSGYFQNLTTRMSN